MTSNCINCSIDIEHNFCPICGQAKFVPKIDKKFIIYDLQHGIFHFDNSFLSTLFFLFKEPGVVIKNFIAGNRKKYANPFTLLLFLSTIYMFLSLRYGDNMSKWKWNDNNDKFETIVTYLINHHTWFVLFILPIISFITFNLFKKSNYNYYEILVFECFIQTKILVINFFTLLINYFFDVHFTAVLLFIVVGFLSIRAKVLFFDCYSFYQVVLRSLLAIIFNWIGILFFLFVLALSIYFFNTLIHE